MDTTSEYFFRRTRISRNGEQGTAILHILLHNAIINTRFAPHQVDVTTDGFKINLQLNISVNNPNYFSATFANISAVASYPIGNSSNLGGGSLANVKFPSHETKNLLFPFVVEYTAQDDPSYIIAKDIASKCGFTDGSTPSDIKVNYDVTVRASWIHYHSWTTLMSQLLT